MATVSRTYDDAAIVRALRNTHNLDGIEKIVKVKMFEQDGVPGRFTIRVTAEYEVDTATAEAILVEATPDVV